MEQQTNFEQNNGASNERAVAWARQMMARKRATQKRMEEEFKNNPEAQALVDELFRRNKTLKVNDRI